MGTPTLALEKKADPTPEEVRFILSGNLCRCTGYQKIGKCKKPVWTDTSSNQSFARALNTDKSMNCT